VFWPSWFKRQALRFWLRFAEKGPGTAAVMYPPGATDDEKQKALAAAEAIINTVAVAIPENFKLVKQLLTSARAQNPAVYEKLYAEMKYSIARRILGQTLTSFGNEGGTGAKSLGDVHAEVEDEISQELAKNFAAVMNDQVVKPLVLWNFGPKAPMPSGPEGARADRQRATGDGLSRSRSATCRRRTEIPEAARPTTKCWCGSQSSATISGRPNVWRRCDVRR
jgi:phage gp29-like protein